jgi:hypothetical protein
MAVCILISKRMDLRTDSKRFSRMGRIHIQITKGSDSPLTERKQLHGTSVFLSCEISPFFEKEIEKNLELFS